MYITIAWSTTDRCVPLEPRPRKGSIVREVGPAVLPPPSPERMIPPRPPLAEVKSAENVSVLVPTTRTSVPSETGVPFTVTVEAPGVRVFVPTTMLLG